MKNQEKLSPKVEALYKAVMELLLEGREIRKMKVSEITERAGIGKGTAYEYFESREELLIDALNYYQKTWTEEIGAELARRHDFMERVSYLFEILDAVLEKVKKEALTEVCNIFFFSPIFRREKEGMAECLYHIVEWGKRGGELGETFPDEYIVLALSGKIFNYISYFVDLKGGRQSACSLEQVKKYLLDSIRMEFTRRQ